jgi:hypothetical protein
MYRYRDTGGSTSNSLRKAEKHLYKVGKPLYVKGYIYKGRYNTTRVGVLIKGTHGSLRLNGLSWGYYGEGPRGLITLLTSLKVKTDTITSVSNITWQPDSIGTCWKVSLCEKKDT